MSQKPTPDAPWWLQSNYAPVAEEVTALQLEVEGAIPPELDGLYVRNGANAKRGGSGHWFLGQGMVHGVRLAAGEAQWYRNRWVQTPLLDREPSATPAPPTLSDSASNVALAHHGDRLLSLGEVGLPYELSPQDLSTLGIYDFGGRLTTSMTAHPKIDPDTGEMLMFGYNFMEPYLTYHQVDVSGTLARSTVIDIPGPAMMHDFAVTSRHVVFMDLPIVFNLELAIAGDPFPFRWDDAHGARLGVMPRTGGNDEVRWYEIDPCFIFHVMNAYDHPDDADALVLDAVRYEKLWDGANTQFDTLARLYRYRLDLATGSVRAQQIDERAIEFPQIDARRMGKPYQHAYALQLRASERGVPGGASAALKYDHRTGSVTAREFHPAEQSDELIFVPASATAGEDEGYLLSYVFDQRTNTSDLLILDASSMSSAPVARVKLPQRVPYGFHGLWMPAG